MQQHPTRNIAVEQMGCKPVEQYEVEVCEHKGIGHPDTITDGVCESSSRELSKQYLKQFGTILHHNLDKGLLVAGTSAPAFGGGKITSPAKLIICGRAISSVQQKTLNTPAICISAAKKWLAANIRAPEFFSLSTEVREGAGNLVDVFSRKNAVPLANDTSFGVGYAPYSLLEKTVLDVSRLVRSEEFLQRFPMAGDDVKIMGLRHGSGIKLTMAMAFIDKHIKSVREYFDIKEQVRQEILDNTAEKLSLQINTSDDKDAKDENGIYLTVTGLSAEMGDDGQVGRGNRANGLITPNRLMSLEASAGKNPVNHVGKLYNVLASLIAKDIFEQVEAVECCQVKLLSAIGQPIDQPQVASVEVLTKHGIENGLKAQVERITNEWLANISKVTQLILDEQVRLY